MFPIRPVALFLAAIIFLSNSAVFAQVSNPRRTAAQTASDAALYDASLDGDIDAVQRAIKNGADVNSYSSDGRTPLIAAALSLHYKVIDALLKAGARAEMQNEAGETAADLLGYAKTPPDAGDAEGTALIRFMAEKGAAEKKLNDSAFAGTELARQLINSIAKGDQESASQLISKGAYLDYKDSRSRLVPTPLIIAVNKGLIGLVELLVERGVRIDRADAQGRTALFYAVGAQNLAMVTLLVKKGGADPNKKVGDVSIASYARTKPNKQISDLLGKAQSERLASDFFAGARKLNENLTPGPSGQNELTTDEKELFKIIDDRKTLHFMLEGSMDRVIALLQKGTNANVRDNNGKTPLMRAAENDDGFLVLALINHGKADINAAMPDGTTALMLAAKADLRGEVDQLLYLGADKGLRDRSGRSAYDHAVQRNGEVLAKLGAKLKPN